MVTPQGRVVEEIAAGAFKEALGRAENVTMTRDHDPAKVLAETRSGSLSLYEDAIGLHYDAWITDPETRADAKAGKIRGLSFGMRNVQGELEERAGDLPLRRVKSLDLDHITLVIHKCPVYAATSVELRAEGETAVELRGGPVSPAAPQYDNSAYQARLDALKNH